MSLDYFTKLIRCLEAPDNGPPGSLHGNSPGICNPHHNATGYTNTGYRYAQQDVAHAFIVINPTRSNNRGYQNRPAFTGGSVNYYNYRYEDYMYSPPPFISINSSVNDKVTVVTAAIKNIKRANSTFGNKIMALTSRFKQMALLNQADIITARFKDYSVTFIYCYKFSKFLRANLSKIAGQCSPPPVIAALGVQPILSHSF